MLMPGPPWQVAGGMAAGLTGGFLSGLSGVGGGFILLPMLRTLLAMPQRQAQGVTLAALLLPITLPALVHYHRNGVAMPWSLAGMLILGFLPGVWAGAELACRLPESPLRWVFVGFLLLLAAWTVVPLGFRPQGPAPGRLWKGHVVGVAGGFCSGLLGIGGGVIMIPLLLLWLRLPQLEAQLLSLAVMVPPIRLPGLLVYLQGPAAFPWFAFYGMAAGFTLGCFLGARCATRVSLPRLRGTLVGLMLATAGLMAWRG